MLHYDEPSIVLVSAVIFEYTAYAFVVILFPWSLALSENPIKRVVTVSLVAAVFSLVYVTMLSTIEWLEFGRNYSFWNGFQFSLYHLPYVIIAYAVVSMVLKLLNRSNNIRITKYANIKMTKLESEQLFREIVDLLTENEYYLRNNLKLSDVSNRLEVPINKASRAINENFGASFSDLLNSLRVNHARKLLSDPGNDHKLFAIAMDSGFNNKVSFHKHFKKIVGMSPHQYRAKQRIDLQSRN